PDSSASSFFFLSAAPPPMSTLFPYTTLFRSCISPTRPRANEGPSWRSSPPSALSSAARRRRRSPQRSIWRSSASGTRRVRIRRTLCSREARPDERGCTSCERASLGLTRSVELRPGEVVLVTYDADARELVARLPRSEEADDRDDGRRDDEGRDNGGRDDRARDAGVRGATDGADTDGGDAERGDAGRDDGARYDRDRDEDDEQDGGGEDGRRNPAEGARR